VLISYNSRHLESYFTDQVDHTHTFYHHLLIKCYVPEEIPSYNHTHYNKY